MNNILKKGMIMKGKIRLLAVAVAAALSVNAAHADDDVNIGYSELPLGARMFIEKYFGTSPNTEEIEYKDAPGVYAVELRNGYDVKFGRDGKVIEIDSPDMKDIDEAIVRDILPVKAVKFLEEKKLLDDVDEIRVQRNGGYLVEVDKIASDRKYRFDSDGKLQERKGRH